MDKPRINPKTGKIIEDIPEGEELQVITTRHIRGKEYQICSDGKIYSVRSGEREEIEVNDKNQKLIDEILSLYRNLTTDVVKSERNKGEVDR